MAWTVLDQLRRSVAPGASDRRAWLAVFLGVLPIYLLTAHYGHSSVDTQSSVLPAWQLVHHGNIWVEHLDPRVYWAVPSGDHLVSNRMPGTVLVNLPFVALLYWLGPSLVPSALTAAFLTAAAVGVLFLVFRRLTDQRSAVLATAVMALGTSLWTIAAAEAWTHTVDALCLALAMYAMSRGRPLWAGIAFAAAITARPHVAVVALVLGIGLAIAGRSLRPMLAVGIPSAIGLAAVIGWNGLVFGGTSVTGGYDSYVSTNLTETSGSSTSFLASNFLGFLFSPQRGLFVFLPIAALLLFGMRAGWREAAPWVRLMALGGVAYTLVQLRINGYGGDAFYGYRLATELVVCTAPLAVLACRSWVAARSWRVQLGAVLAVLSIGLQAVGAFAFDLPRSSSAAAPWRSSPILDAFNARPALAFLVLLVTLCGMLLAQRRTMPKPSGMVRSTPSAGKVRSASRSGLLRSRANISLEPDPSNM
jgi:hypothetical protein